jgi:hypothetical protein
MELAEIARRSNVSLDAVLSSMTAADEFVKLSRGVATRKGNVVHLAAFPIGLGGRAVLNECRAVLKRWHARHGTLLAPVRHENTRARRIAEALGFRKYDETETHVWLAKEAS